MDDATSSDNLLLSDEERLHALNVLGEHFAEGRLDSTEFYDRSGRIAQARTVSSARPAFEGLPGGVPIEVVDGHLRMVDRSSNAPAVQRNTSVTPADPATELDSLRKRGRVVESLDGVILGITLVVFLLLQLVVGWDYAWIVWPSLAITLTVPRMIMDYGDEDEEIYEELKEVETKERKERLRAAAERIRELEGGAGNA